MDSIKIYPKINNNPIKLNSINYKRKEYLFYPRQSDIKNTSKMNSSKSALNIFNMKKNSNSYIKNTFNLRYNSKESDLNKKIFPPIYFYRNIQKPYKYNIISVPEYLIRANQEKSFMDKIETKIKEENNKKIFNEFLKNKEKRRIKDRYKPTALDAQNILLYKPNLYSNLYKFAKNLNNTSINNNLIEDKEKKNEKYSHNDEIKTEEINDNKNYDLIQKISNQEQLSDINNEINKNLIKNEIISNKIKNKSMENKNINEWIPNRDYGTKMNFFSSVSYNIISPMCKGLNDKFITPTELNKNNLYNESPAFHKVKSISEYLDLIRVYS